MTAVLQNSAYDMKEPPFKLALLPICFFKGRRRLFFAPPFQRHSIVHFISVTDVPPFKVLSPQNIRISVYSVARPKRKETFFWMRAFLKEEL